MFGEEIISKALSLLPSDRTMALQYLEELQFDLENRNLSGGWIDELKGFMRGVHASGLIDVASLDEFERLLIETASNASENDTQESEHLLAKKESGDIYDIDFTVTGCGYEPE